METYRQLLRDLGIEEHGCMLCGVDAWKFQGDIDAGITRVTCPSCGRLYERQTWGQAVATIAHSVALAAAAGNLGTAWTEYNRLTQIVNDVAYREQHSSRLQCVFTGNSADDEDEPPF